MRRSSAVPPLCKAAIQGQARSCRTYYTDASLVSSVTATSGRSSMDYKPGRHAGKPRWPSPREGAAMPKFLIRTAVVLAFLALAPPARAVQGDEHLFLGNPSGAVADKAKSDNY